MLCLYVCVRGACAVRVARDELLALLAFVVHRVAQSARQRHQEANERDAEDEDATVVEALTSRDLWEQSIMRTGVVCFVVERGGRARRVRSWTSSRSCYHQKKDEDEPHNHADMRLKRRPGLTGIRFFAVICARSLSNSGNTRLNWPERYLTIEAESRRLCRSSFT